jgi:hypothetical protein
MHPVSRHLLACQCANEGLARQAHQQWHAQSVENGELLQHIEIVPEVLAEADARVGDQPRPVDARRNSGHDASLQRVIDVERHVIVTGAQLHGLRIALRMHQDDRAIGLRHGRQRLRVILEG